MADLFENWLENALADYRKVVFLYQPSESLCIGLEAILKKEKKKLLLLTSMESLNFSCSQRRLSEEECMQLLKLYFTYSFSDRFVLLTDRKMFPWPSVAGFVVAGVAETAEILEAMLK